MSAENVNILTSPHSPWHLVPLTQHFSSLSQDRPLPPAGHTSSLGQQITNKIYIWKHFFSSIELSCVVITKLHLDCWRVFITWTVIRSAEGPCAAACQRGGKAPGTAGGALTELYWPRLCWLSRGQAAVQRQASSVFTSDPGRREFFSTPC